MIIFSSISLNMCAHWEGSFEYPQQIKKMIKYTLFCGGTRRLSGPRCLKYENLMFWLIYFCTKIGNLAIYINYYKCYFYIIVWPQDKNVKLKKTAKTCCSYLKRTIKLRLFFWVPKTYVKVTYIDMKLVWFQVPLWWMYHYSHDNMWYYKPWSSRKCQHGERHTPPCKLCAWSQSLSDRRFSAFYVEYDIQ